LKIFTQITGKAIDNNGLEGQDKVEIYSCLKNKAYPWKVESREFIISELLKLNDKIIR